MKKLIVISCIFTVPIAITYMAAPEPLPQLYAPSFLLGIAGLAITLHALSLLSQSKTMRGTIIALIAGILFLEFLDLICIFKTERPFNISFLQHLNFDSLRVASGFELAALLCMCIAVVALSILGFLIYRKPEKKNGRMPSHWSKAAFLLMGALLVCGFSNPPKDVVFFVEMAYFRHQALRYDLQKAGIKPCDIDYAALKAEKGKNLVFIFLESFENAFTDEKLFPGLTPNINRLKKKGVCFDCVKMPKESCNSITGMYSAWSGNQMLKFQIVPWTSSSYNFSMLTLPEILKKAGYEQTFLFNDVPGVGDMDMLIKHAKFDKVMVREKKDNDFVSGKYSDAALFKSALSECMELASSGKPFNVSLFTHDTHSPGFNDPSLESYDSSKVHSISGKTNDVLTAAHHTYKALGDFIDELKKMPEWKNTVVFIINDHLMPASTVSPALSQCNDRKMLMLAIGGGLAPKTISTEGKTYDATPTVIDLLGVKSNYVFPIGESLLGSPSPARLDDESDMRDNCLSAYMESKRISQ